ncbi:MAG: fructose-6-phosphate aldolase [Deltaproteobacteria bacterium]|uniref:Probable transaldolase n=1 Tax=Candidatus Zymogenus saltonus TaxID=2844893 RepID=A0A9D8PSI5_9DELT|nr:fructose-6-phosphate aldolase [Candidatus Zymogenus saltonus]
MELFIDTADVAEIKEAAEMGVIDGVTTNPSLVAKSGRKFMDVLKEIVEIVDGPVSAEVISIDAKGMIKEAEELVKIGGNIVIKIPLIEEGLKAIKELSGRGIKTNVTLVFSPLQALLAAKAGGTYVSPFVGRLDDIAHEGMEIVEDIVTIYDNYAYETKVLVASIRNPIHLLESARLGADVATVPMSVIRQLTRHPLTDRGLEKFLEDWKKVPK